MKEVRGEARSRIGGCMIGEVRGCMMEHRAWSIDIEHEAWTMEHQVPRQSMEQEAGIIACTMYHVLL